MDLKLQLRGCQLNFNYKQFNGLAVCYCNARPAGLLKSDAQSVKVNVLYKRQHYSGLMLQ